MKNSQGKVSVPPPGGTADPGRKAWQISSAAFSRPDRIRNRAPSTPYKVLQMPPLRNGAVADVTSMKKRILQYIERDKSALDSKCGVSATAAKAGCEPAPNRDPADDGVLPPTRRHRWYGCRVMKCSTALTASFEGLVQRHVAHDPAFGGALLREGIDTMLAGDVDTGKAILRDYIKATIGFEKLGEATGTQPKEPHPHVRPARQSAGPQPLQRARLPAEAGRP